MKNLMDKIQDRIIVISFIMVAFLLIFLFVGYPLIQDYYGDIACKKIGFIEQNDYINDNGIDYCLDKEGNMYSVRMECNFWGSECVAKPMIIRSYEGVK